MSVQHRIGHVRKPRIHITCDVEDYSTPRPARRPPAPRPVISLRIPLPTTPPAPPVEADEPPAERVAA